MEEETSEFLSPPRPTFYENYDSPLSTKQEKKRALTLSAPRLVRTAPALSRVYPRRFTLDGPHFVSFKHNVERRIPNSPYYNVNGGTYFEQCFEMEKKIGEGSFGEVFRVRWKDDGQFYAVKRSIEYYRNAADRELKLREVQKHELLPKHRNLIEFIQAWEECGRLYIQTELCQYSLADYARREHSIPEQQLWFYVSDLVAAVCHLHDHSLLHLDIKPENIFVSCDGICKLGDFGLIFDLKKDTALTAQEGDSKYLAPEVLNEPPDKAADIFSLGMTILELATDLDMPNRGEGWHMLRRSDIPQSLLDKMSPRLRSMVLWMIDPKPDKRPTAEQLMKDVIIQHYLALRKVHLCTQVTHLLKDTLWWMCLYLISSLRWLLSPIVAPIFRWRKRRYDSTPVKQDDSCAARTLRGVVFSPNRPSPQSSSFAHAQSIRDGYLSDDDDLEHVFSSPARRRISAAPIAMRALDSASDSATTSSSSVESYHLEDEDASGAKPRESEDEGPSGKRQRLSESPVRTPLMSTTDNEQPDDYEFEDGDDHEIVLISAAKHAKNRNTMSAPVRRPLRAQIRGSCTRPLPKLDFGILDSPKKGDDASTSNDSASLELSSDIVRER